MSDKELFMAALDVPEAEAGRFVSERAVDAEQAKRVEELLKSHRAAGPFLAMSSGEAPATKHMHFVRLHGTRDQAGQIISGRYKLVENIGQGGMGTVWMAEQMEPVRRLVAIKLIKPGMDSRQVLARFEAERQALAMMDHPHIAKIHDGGSLPDGRPFFVMELVKGIPVTQYCDERQLSITERLHLLLQICQAVQHAHQKGILHRDLKPGNLLVTEHDGKPVPKVIDFGLAKAIGEGNVLTDQTLHTGFGTVVGTPLYMAPEQVALNTLDIDTRADIYSLGVVFYELLTGSTPLERERFQTSAWEEMKRLIREEEPPKPSTRLSSSNALPSIASRRHAEPAQLGRIIRGELDWIVMKALEKDRNRRYATANALAEDVTRFLNHEAVHAGPPSASYKVKKFVGRNRSAVLAAAAMLLLLVAGIIGTTWGMVAAWQQRDRAILAEEAERQQKIQVQQAAHTVSVVNDFLLKDLLGQGELSNQPKEAGERTADIKVRTLVDRAATRIDGKFPDAPLTEMSIRTTLGNVYESLGLYPEAEKQLQRVMDLSERHLSADHPSRINAQAYMAHLRHRQGQYLEANRLQAATIDKQTATKGVDHPDTLQARLHEAMHFNTQSKPKEAEKLVRDVMVHSDKLDTLVLAMAHHELGWALHLQRRQAEGEPLLRQALAVRLKAYGPDHPIVMANQNNLGLNLIEQRKYKEAEAIYVPLIALNEAKLGTDHPDTLAARGNYAKVLKGTGRIDEAIALIAQVLEQRIKKQGPDHPNTLATRYSLAVTLVQQKQLTKAEALLEENLGYSISKLGPDQVNTLMIKMELAHVYMDLNKYAKAEPLFRECLAAKEHHGMMRADAVILESNLGLMLFKQKKYDEAEPHLLKVYDKLVGNKGYLAHKPRVATWLTEIYDKTGKTDKAERWREEVKRSTPERPPVK